MICPPSRTGCCSRFNNECFEGFFPMCLGWTNDLLGCFGNMNLCCYTYWCLPFAIADMTVANGDGSKRQWWTNLIILCFCPVLGQLLQSSAPDVAYVFNSLSPVVTFYIAYSALCKLARRMNLYYTNRSLKCCLTWMCCMWCHITQAARELETHHELQQNILDNRPDECKCCNCWIVELGVGREGEMAPLIADIENGELAA